jgi:hypothetical protein
MRSHPLWQCYANLNAYSTHHHLSTGQLQLTVKGLKSGKRIEIAVEVAMASETLGIGLYEVWHTGCALLSLLQGLKTQENSNLQKSEQVWEYVLHMVAVVQMW